MHPWHVKTCEKTLKVDHTCRREKKKMKMSWHYNLFLLAIQVESMSHDVAIQMRLPPLPGWEQDTKISGWLSSQFQIQSFIYSCRFGYKKRLSSFYVLLWVYCQYTNLRDNRRHVGGSMESEKFNLLQLVEHNFQSQNERDGDRKKHRKLK